MGEQTTPQTIQTIEQRAQALKTKAQELRKAADSAPAFGGLRGAMDQAATFAGLVADFAEGMVIELQALRDSWAPDDDTTGEKG